MKSDCSCVNPAKGYNCVLQGGEWAVIYVQIMQPFGMGYYPAYDYHYSLLPVNHGYLPGYAGKVITFNLAV